ncbi:Rrf2 family transcriptional regulator [Enterobacter hormaechei]|nr:Rrf2 family transcriptional regulator [Enterobacter hormaechei]
MKRDSKFSGILHVLLHMAANPEPVTSDVLSHIMQTNPVVIRRTLAGLRKKGYVSSEKGSGGGWKLTAELSQINLAGIWHAIGESPLIALNHRTESPGCRVETAVNCLITDVCEEAQALILSRLEKITLEQLVDNLQLPSAERFICPTFNKERPDGE